MISLKRNGKLELVEAKGIRVRQSSMYTPNQNEDFLISLELIYKNELPAHLQELFYHPIFNVCS